MANVFPTRIEQVNDFSQRAGDRLLDIMGKAPDSNYASIIAKVVDTATKAQESQRLTDAVDAYNRAMEAGKSASEALKGLDPRMTGSKAFKDQADKIRASILGQRADDRAADQWRNTLRLQGMQEDATTLASELYSFANKAGGENAGIWFEKNLPRFKNNPYAYKAVTDLAKSQGYSFAPYSSSGSVSGVQVPDEAALATAENGLNQLMGRFKAKGLTAPLSEEEALTMSNFDSWLEHQAKNLGYIGDAGKYSDFRENMQQAYNQLRAEAGDLPIEAVLYAMKTHMDNGGILYWDQEDIDTTAAKDWLRKNGANWYKDYNDMVAAKRAFDVIKKANADLTTQKALATLKAKRRLFDNMEQLGDITWDERNDMLARSAATINNTNADLMTALKSALSMLSDRGLVQLQEAKK